MHEIRRFPDPRVRGELHTGAARQRRDTFEEKNQGIYIEADGATQLLERGFRFNASVRYVKTHQTLTTSLFSTAGEPNPN